MIDCYTGYATMLLVGRPKRQATITCGVCGTIKTMAASMARVTKYCSRECYWKRRRKHPKTLICERCGREYPNKNTLTASRRRRYCSIACRAAVQNKGGSVSSQGYRVIYLDGKPVLEHRHVMEKILGRPLLSTESIHHRDGDRLNNDPPNLELWDKSQPFGQRVSEKIEWAITFLGRHGYHVSPPHSDALSAFVKLVESRGPLP